MHINEGFIEHLPLINITHYIFININQTATPQHTPSNTIQHPTKCVNILRHSLSRSTQHKFLPFTFSKKAFREIDSSNSRGWQKKKIKREKCRLCRRYQKFHPIYFFPLLQSAKPDVVADEWLMNQFYKNVRDKAVNFSLSPRLQRSHFMLLSLTQRMDDNGIEYSLPLLVSAQESEWEVRQKSTREGLTKMMKNNDNVKNFVIRRRVVVRERNYKFWLCVDWAH